MSKLAPTGIVPGSWYAFCDTCARRFFGHTLRMRWDNRVVCDECWEPRHPQDFIKAVKDNRAIPKKLVRTNPNEPAEAVTSYDPNTQNWYGY